MTRLFWLAALLAGCAAGSQQVATRPAVAYWRRDSGISAPRRPDACSTIIPGNTRGITSKVVFEYTVLEDGTVQDVRLVNLEANRDLFNGLKQWVEACRYIPARTVDGRAVPIRFVTEYRAGGFFDGPTRAVGL
jgi:hypothetical protein